MLIMHRKLKWQNLILNDMTIKIIDPFTNIELMPIATADQSGDSTFLSNLKAINIGDGGTNVFRADKDGIFLGAKTFATAPFKVSMAGAVTATSITITGGTLKYGKTGFTDAVNAGYYMGSEGIYFGAATDATKLKYTISSGLFDFIGTISSRSTATLASAIDSSGHFVDTALNTSAKTILGDFTFGVSGAIKIITDVDNGIWISPTGILGKKAGNPTFSIGVDGTANFYGTIAASQVVAGTLTGFTIQTAATGSRVKITGSGDEIAFMYDDTTYNAIDQYSWAQGYGLRLGDSGGTALDLATGTTIIRALLEQNDAGWTTGTFGIYGDASNDTFITTDFPIIPSTSLNLGSPTAKWQHLYLSGNIIIDGTVDGVDISAHAGNADAHHSSVSNALAITPSSVNCGSGALKGGYLYYGTTEIAILTGGYLDLARPIIHYFGSLTEASEGSKGMMYVKGSSPNEEVRVYLNGGWRTINVT